MANLKEETLKMLSDCGKTVDDIRWIGGFMGEIPVDQFFKVADREYDDGFGSAEVMDIYIVGDDWWLERGEYDGSEWWEYKTIPAKPTNVTDDPLDAVFGKRINDEDDDDGWC